MELVSSAGTREMENTTRRQLIDPIFRLKPLKIATGVPGRAGDQRFNDKNYRLLELWVEHVQDFSSTSCLNRLQIKAQSSDITS